MKKLISFLALALVGVALATPTYYQRTDNRDVEFVNSEAFSILLLDVLLQPGDSAFSRPIDLLKVPVNYRDTGTGDLGVSPDYSMGTGILTCYDILDSSGLTDSVDVTGQLYVSQYAADNANPTNASGDAGISDAWATLGSAYSLDAASAAAGTRVEANAAIALSSPLDRFVRLKLINDNATIKDRSRCKFYWVRKAFKR